MIETVNHQSDAAMNGYEFARGMDKYNSEKEAERQKALYKNAKAAAEKAKTREDIIVKSLFTAAAGAFAGRAIPDMGAGASAGAVAGCGIIAMLGDYAYDWVIRKPISFVKNAVVGCFRGMAVSQDSIQIEVNAVNSVNIYDRETVTDTAIIAKASDDARACDYDGAADRHASLKDKLDRTRDSLARAKQEYVKNLDELTKAEGGVFPAFAQNANMKTVPAKIVTANDDYDNAICDCEDVLGSCADACGCGCNRVMVIGAQTLLLGAAVGASVIPTAYPDSVALKVIGGVVSGGLTAFMSSMPYIANCTNSVNVENTERSLKNAEKALARQKTDIASLKQKICSANERKSSVTAITPMADGKINQQVLSPTSSSTASVSHN